MEKRQQNTQLQVQSHKVRWPGFFEQVGHFVHWWRRPRRMMTTKEEF